MPLYTLIFVKRNLTAHGRRISLRLLWYVNAWQVAIRVVYKAAKSPGDSDLKGASELTDVCKIESEIKALIAESFVTDPFQGRQGGPCVVPWELTASWLKLN